MIRRMGLAIFAMVFFTFNALAGGAVKPYATATFSEALSSGKAIVVHVHADWCPTCRKQQPTIQSMAGDSALSSVAFIEVNFDKDQDFLQAHRVPNQSVILVFKGGKEVARLNGVTDPDQIRSEVQAAIS